MERTTDRSFDFLPINERGQKPRKTGITEMRGPYYAPVGKRYLQDILETGGAYGRRRRPPGRPAGQGGGGDRAGKEGEPGDRHPVRGRGGKLRRGTRGG